MCQEFIKIDINSILERTVPQFDIFINKNNKPILYRSKNLEFSEKQKEHILDNQDTVMIKQEETSAYNNYILDNIQSLYKKTISIRKKTEYLYENSKLIIKNIFHNPESADTKNNVSLLTESSLNILEQSDYNIKDLVDIMKFEYSTYTHSINVSLLLSGFAKRLGVNKRLLQNLVEGGFLHDIGKSKIDKSILLKPDRLTGSEWNKMKQHTLFGFDIINNLEYHNNTIKNVVLYHHEKYNGKGYPKGLSKDKIPFEAQLTSLCDVFDALTTKRCYKSAVGSFSAFKIMLEEMENHFNPNLLKDFIKYFHI